MDHFARGVSETCVEEARSVKNISPAEPQSVTFSHDAVHIPLKIATCLHFFEAS